MDVENDINETLMNAISECDAKAVKYSLDNGANPNFHVDHEWYKESPESQPDSPLKLVMFRASDNLLSTNKLKALKNIAEVLLTEGAASEPAKKMAEIRYGVYNKKRPDNVFEEIISLVMK